MSTRENLRTKEVLEKKMPEKEKSYIFVLSNILN